MGHESGELKSTERQIFEEHTSLFIDSRIGQALIDQMPIHYRAACRGTLRCSLKNRSHLQRISCIFKGFLPRMTCKIARDLGVCYQHIVTQLKVTHGRTSSPHCGQRHCMSWCFGRYKMWVLAYFSHQLWVLKDRPRVAHKL